MSDDRPNPRPRPLPTGGDPAVPSTAPASVPAAVPAAVPARGRRASRALVTLNTRVEPLLDDLVDLICQTQGMSKRDVVETALKKAYASEYRALLAREQAS
jgi:hypothetical protein